MRQWPGASLALRHVFGGVVHTLATAPTSNGPGRGHDARGRGRLGELGIAEAGERAALAAEKSGDEEGHAADPGSGQRPAARDALDGRVVMLVWGAGDVAPVQQRGVVILVSAQGTELRVVVVAHVVLRVGGCRAAHGRRVAPSAW